MKNFAENPQKAAWEKIAPTWPLQNVIACNPLQGFEKLSFFEALSQGEIWFEAQEIPEKLQQINRITIKWCQVFFDQGQATIKMPNRKQGFFKSWLKLAVFDEELGQNSRKKREFLQNLPKDSSQAILEILQRLAISEEKAENFLTFLLTSLSGWSAYVKYLGEWNCDKNPEIETDYLAIRLVIAAMVSPNIAEELERFFIANEANKESRQKQAKQRLAEIVANENEHRHKLLTEIQKNQEAQRRSQENDFDAQLVFCIDVRSEPIRRAIEQSGNYETFGFAGFFGVPAAITNDLTQETYSSCPVLLSPKHNIVEKSNNSYRKKTREIAGFSTLQEIKKFYQSLKYNFSTPLALAEAMGIWSGAWMLLKTFSPKSPKFLKIGLQKSFGQNCQTSPEISAISFEERCAYSIGFLRAIGLTKNFAKLVILCGHGSQSENNSFATALDCGACGGRHGDGNAKILAEILNQKEVRNYLLEFGIKIPDDTQFIAAKHNTTTDEIEFYPKEKVVTLEFIRLKRDLEKAKFFNNCNRAKEMGFGKENQSALSKFFFLRSNNWGETQPEWGLAKNASFIIAPRSLTKNLDLGGRSFLHSYNWKIDEDNKILHLILNAPAVVAQWINSQYLFSTLNNSAFGAGSKITQNVVGKIGVMQGNGSDLMSGLPMQSVFANDRQNYHLPARLLILVCAPQEKIDAVLAQSPKIQELLKNGWIKLICLGSEGERAFELSGNFE